MKTQSLKLIEQKGLTYVKTPESRVFRPDQLQKEIYNNLSPEMDKLEYAANLVRKPIYFYPLSEERTLMNFGPHTSVIMNNLPQKELSSFLSAQVEKTYKSCNII